MPTFASSEVVDAHAGIGHVFVEMQRGGPLLRLIARLHGRGVGDTVRLRPVLRHQPRQIAGLYSCLLYTSDAADEL